MPSANVPIHAVRGWFLTTLGTVALATSLALSGVALTSASEDGGSVVVTTEVLGSVVSQLVGDAGEVSVIMPSGANPHSYEPSARDAERMLGADVLVSNGLDLEEALLAVLETAASEGATWFQAAEHIVVREFDSSAEDQPADEPPRRARSTSPEIAALLDRPAGDA